MKTFTALTILCWAAVSSASPINSDPRRPHEFIIAKTDSKDLSGDGKYKIIEIIPLEDYTESKNISKVAGVENTNSRPDTQIPNFKDQNEENNSGSKNLARILEEVKDAVPEEQKYNEQNPEPESEKDPENSKERIELLLRTAKPEVQKYDEQNPESASEKQNYENSSENSKERIELLLRTAKPEVQKYDEQNPEPASERQKYENSSENSTDFKPQYTQDVITRVIDQTHNGPSYAEIIEIQPDSETLKHYNINKPQTIETINPVVDVARKPKVGERYKPKYVVPEAPTFTTRISVPPLPISLSSIRSMMANWPHEVPSIFKAPRIIYLGHQ